MKKLLASTFLFSVGFSAIAGAVDVNNPLYIPSQGRLISSTTIQYADSKAENTVNGVKESSESAYEWGVTEQFVYNFTGSLLFTLKGDVAFGNKEVDYAPGEGTDYEYDTQGFKNPEIGVIYRAIDNGAYVVDALFSYTPDLQNEEIGSASKDGNVVPIAGNIYSLGAKIGANVSPDDTVALTAKYNLVTDRDQEYKTNFDKYNWDDFSVITLALDYQHAFGQSWSMNAGAGLLWIPAKIDISENGELASKYENGNKGTLSFSVNYNLVPEQSAISFGYTYQADLDDGEYQYANGDTVKVEDGETHYFSVGYKYLF